MSLWLTEQGIDHDRVFADTGWEHPATYEYLRGPLTAKLGPITEVRGPRGMADLVLHKNMFPARVRRFCTEELKVKPLIAYFAALPDDVDHVNAVGIRAAESQARARLPEWEWSDAFDCYVWRPLIRWTEADVITMHSRHGLAPNPLYLQGARRVGCWPCIFASKAELRMLARIDPARVDEIEALEQQMHAKRDATFAARGEEQTRPSTFFTLRPGGKHVPTPIRDVIAWATSETSGQMRLDTDGDEGCMRWGLCEPVQHTSTQEDQP